MRILTFTQKCKGPRLVKMILKNNKTGGLIQADFKTFYKTNIIKRMLYRLIICI